MRSNASKVFFLAVLLFSMSCSSYKTIPYFQDLDHTKISQESIDNYTPLKIQPGDLLGINVNSLSPVNEFSSANTRINGNNDNNGGGTNKSNIPNGSENTNANPVFGYRVSPAGEIDLPYLGKMKVTGMTTDGLAAKLNPLLEQYLKQPIVNIRILNFKISVMGDVLRPDVYTIQNERITIMEALGLAGDLNITAKRKNVILIREYDGKREYLPVDLTSKKIFSSPYYYLQNNDVIYVEPDRIKYAPLDRGYRTLTTVLAVITTAGVVVTSYFLYHNSK
ncbi:polysaccharide biosynthesis/export family protein [Mucilaginibacter sp. UR6-11]|uniref:polysaccharide biosynthesis/export family protein n=1 Tax=Mucilaginibacter sp. UR6-11 TaxID=1435644 RepID=UPI001E32D9BB|nr:polysaccharide biosynthesis/export family protein [Mucilaginibacter sp. UR6-11]MCC8426196.1 polysaccharide biosynthesis/export family protein [Mucilaginibacter sp. UR6-11]